ncbi:ADP-ribosylglycohydrolase family protein [Nonomuraea antimicrobica]|uniref:ADP-ribosylglycohydrolase family protein n=1 Tax=Nonomuraea antimicrobica TaxID=561173 RepID=A0ABP7BUE1_9ACTN
MSKSAADYAEAIYAGVLGKIIGVYLGRPVEGWPYEDIQTRFGELSYYINSALGLPLIVADDDISGTFAFFRAVADNGPDPEPTAEQIGDTWLNYVIEDKTILWWGGLGRSTEHTAFLRLRAGVTAPASGSAEMNGHTLSEQVGSQIFSDAFSMMHPGDPERAAALVRRAASVSHDGIAVEAAAFLGALRALAFDVTDLHRLIEQCRGYVTSPLLQRVIDDVVDLCAKEDDWRAVRDRIDRRHGYRHYPGPCHVVPNHAMTLAALLLGGDDFQRSVMIASSAGFDTDSNAGCVGSLNGVRLGLDALTAQVDLRAAVADRLLVVTADGGACVSDAVREADQIVRAAARARGESLGEDLGDDAGPRFGFRYRGSVQGFQSCPYAGAAHPAVEVEGTSGAGLLLRCRGLGPGLTAAASTPVFLDPADRMTNFSTVASPSLYPGQVVTARIRADRSPAPSARLYVLHHRGGEIRRSVSEPFVLGQEPVTLRWQVPDVGADLLFRFGIELDSAERFDGTVTVEEVDWRGAPTRFTQSGVLLSSIWDTHPVPLDAWVASARNFEADFGYSYSVSHPGELGVVTIGSRDWDDYSAGSTLMFSLHDSGGLVVRSAGHRRFYAAVFSGGSRVSLVKQRDRHRQVLAACDWPYEQDRGYDVRLSCTGSEIELLVDGERVLHATDTTMPYRHGGAGFLIERGTMLADGIAIAATRPERRPA